MNNAELSFRVDPVLKEQAAHLFQELGLSTSAALRLFLERAVICQGLPFEVSLNASAEDKARNALWSRDAERMHANGDDRMVMPRKPRIADGTEWGW
jgi:DNA-damage-inducible protein J